jgi:hypothetical protein
MVAPQCRESVPQRFVEDSVVSRCMRDALVEDRNPLFIGIFIERLEIDIRGQRSSWPDGVKQGLQDHIDAALYQPTDRRLACTIRTSVTRMPRRTKSERSDARVAPILDRTAPHSGNPSRHCYRG